MRVSLEVTNLLTARFSGVAAASFNFLNGFQPLTFLGGFGDGAKTFGGLLLPQVLQTRKAFRLFWFEWEPYEKRKIYESILKAGFQSNIYICTVSA